MPDLTYPTVDGAAAPARPVGPVAAAGFLLGAAAIHIAVVPAHLREYRPFGGFFLTVALLQGLLAVALLASPRPRRLAVAGATGNLALAALYVASRTAGVPLGPPAGRPEPWDVAGVICTLLEVIAASVLLAAVIHTPRAQGPRRWTLALAAGLSVVLTVVGAAAGAAADGSDGTGMPVSGARSPGVSVASLREPPGNQPLRTFTLVARPAVVGGTSQWTYNGVVPGPQLRVNQGDRVRVTLVNHLDVPTTIHWHGLAVPGAEDGLPGLTQDAVAPGHSYVYEFVARDSGTYWYHSHQDSLQQISRGLFGAFVVEPPAGHVAEQRDYVAILHRGDIDAARAVHVNGQPDLRLDAAPGQTVRLRLVDAVAPGMSGAPQAPILYGAPYRVVALDGHDINDPQDLPPEELPLGMGRRADLVFTMPSSGAVRLTTRQITGGPRVSTATVTIGNGPPPPVHATAPEFDLTRYGQPAPGGLTATSHFDATYPVVLSEKPGLANGRPELTHMINGKSSPDGAMFQVRTGWVVNMHIVNNTAEWHPMHLHGHVFTVLSVNGQTPQGSAVQLDTVPVGPHQTWDVAFVADNPGIWMLHCHVLLHASMGMDAMVTYTTVSTPYRLAGPTDNNPDG